MRLITSLGALCCCALLGSAQPTPPAKALSPFEAGMALGRAKQALDTCEQMSKLSRGEEMKKELKEWKEEYEKLEKRVRTLSEKGDPLGEDVQTSLRLLNKGIGEWSAKFVQSRMGEPAGNAKLPLTPFLPKLDLPPGVVVTMDISDAMALSMMQNFLSHPEAQKAMNRMQSQIEDASRGLDLNRPGAMGEFFKRLGENAAKAGRDADKRPMKKP